MWASLIAAALGGAISLYANNQSQQAMERYRNALAADKARAAQKEDYLENVDPLHTKSGSALSTDMGEKLREQNEAAAGRNAVMGGSGHNTAATKDVTSRLMAEYQRSLIRQHEMNIVPQLNYYRSQYDRANAGLEKAEYDKSIANINAASQAAQGAINAVAAGGSMLGNEANVTNGTNVTNAANAANGNGTPTGNIGTYTPPTKLGFENTGLTGNGTQAGNVAKTPTVSATPAVGDPNAAEQYRYNPRQDLTYNPLDY